MITKVRDYLSEHKIVTPKLMARDLDMNEDQIVMILDLLQVRSENNQKNSCTFGICGPKEKLNCSVKCEKQ